MRISELSERTGVSAHALRHYERLGLLHPDRTAGGYRHYPEALRREVVFISMSRKIGFSLKSIGERLPAYRSGKLSFADMVQAIRNASRRSTARSARSRPSASWWWTTSAGCAQEKKAKATLPKDKPWTTTRPPISRS
jgi:MerR family copper efflux transcriptional regulator